MKKTRDDFKPSVKRAMAERVAWRCSWPGCGQITIGPNSTNENSSINNGIASHITAAASNGPRYAIDMTPEDRSSISNGIWMCRHHGNLIDADFEVYTASTLQSWKKEAERVAVDNLKLAGNSCLLPAASFLQIGHNILCFATWVKVEQRLWEFLIQDFFNCSDGDLFDYVASFGKGDDFNKFIVVESQGDARVILDITITRQQAGVSVTCVVKDKSPSGDPKLVGKSLALKDGDIFSENGDIAMVEGVDAAIQILSTTLSTKLGEIAWVKDFGSRVLIYYNAFSKDLTILARLIKMEVIRLALIPIKDPVTGLEKSPLNFVKRIRSTSINSLEVRKGRINVYFCVEWGNLETWQGFVPIYVGS